MLILLSEIQDSYRTYHARACYLADKHPLLLAREFKEFVWKYAACFQMRPSSGHPVDKSFEQLLQATARKNKMFIHEDFPEVRIDDDNGEIAKDAVAVSLSKPILPNKVMDNELSENYTLDSPFGTFLDTFFTEPDSTDDEDDRSAVGGSQSKIIVDHLADLDNKSDISSARSLVGNAVIPGLGSIPGSADAEETYSEAPWLVKSVPWYSLEEATGLEGVEREEYMEQLANGFIAFESGAAVKSNNCQSVVEGSELYKLQLSLVKEYNDRQAMLSDPTYVRANPPMNSEGKPYVAILEISKDKVSDIVVGIRTDIIQTIEQEARDRLVQASALNKERKAELNDELDDRLRTHWPRRGRVETQIKQPREAELLGHEEKTWRHISNIHDRVKVVKNKVDSEMQDTKRTFDEYVRDMANLKNALNNPFKTLAALQGMDVKARGLTLQFQSKCQNHFAKLGKLASEDAAAVKAFALDFRKICPPQIPGKEGGYSESELDEIEKLVRGQCDEIDNIVLSWQSETQQMKEEQTAKEKITIEFATKYEAKALELSLAEGLGQKYGAPRRRAQARLRTEVSRDEAAAGQVDELVATLEFLCAEQRRDLEKIEDANNEDGASASTKSVIDENDKPEGRSQLEKVKEIWSILGRIRVALFGRACYLKVILSSTPATYSDVSTVLSWLAADRIPLRLSECLPGTDKQISIAVSEPLDSKDEPMVSQHSNTLADVVDETELLCRKETKELYLGEGRGDALNADGVPESLQVWLAESRDKLLGSGGYLEKASKRLWAQVERIEVILCRRVSESHSRQPEEDDEDVDDGEWNGEVSSSMITKPLAYGAPGLCLRLLVMGHTKFMRQLKDIRESSFMRVVHVLEKCREKHERNLRPRLGSPDAVDELNRLDAKELERSQEYVDSINKFRNTLVRYIVDRVKLFVEDLVMCFSSLMGFFDRCIHKECLVTPPGCSVPKKRRTAKKLRKAQKLKDAVSQGKEDTSKVRVWPALAIEQLQAVVESSEGLVIPETRPATPALEPEKSALGKKPPLAKAKAVATIDLPPPRSTTLLSNEWLQKITSTSAIRAEVSTAHRTLIEERSVVMSQYVADLSIILENIKDTYCELLAAEAGWSERWKRQVLMLRKGDI